MANPKAPIWSILALLFPLFGATAFWLVVTLTPPSSFGNGYGVVAVLVLLVGAGGVLGVISVVVAFVRRERLRWLRWVALAVNLAPLGWLVMNI